MDNLEHLSDLVAGIAGEHLVCANLLLAGYDAYLTEQFCPYDVVADINGKLLKIQVKTTRKQRAIPQRKVFTPAYLFHVKRCGKLGAKDYQESDFDLMALVALDIEKIAYIKLSEAKRTIHLNQEKFLSLTDIQRVL